MNTWNLMGSQNNLWTTHNIFPFGQLDHYNFYVLWLLNTTNATTKHQGELGSIHFWKGGTQLQVIIPCIDGEKNS